LKERDVLDDSEQDGSAMYWKTEKREEGTG
jgi:hypothetical protein